MAKHILFILVSIFLILAAAFGISQTQFFVSASGGANSARKTAESSQKNETATKKTTTAAAPVATVVTEQPEAATDQTASEAVESTVSNNLEAFIVSIPDMVVGDQQSGNGIQQFAAVWDGDISQVTNIRLVYCDPQGQENEIAEKKRTDEAILFEKDFSDGAEGTYRLIALRYFVEGSDEEKTLDLDDAQISAAFTLTRAEAASTADQSVAQTQIEVQDLNTGEEQVADSVTETLQNAAAESEEASAANAEASSAEADVSSDDPLIIVLNPGHGGTDSGAVNKKYNLKESDLNLKIALACRDELLKYNGVVVYMTRTDDSNSSSDQIISFANDVHADLLVSIHNNACNGSAYGAEVFYPNSNYNSEVSVEGAGVSEKIQDELVALGLYDRGTKTRTEVEGVDSDYAACQYPDGSAGDWYFINRRAKLNGYTGIIVEHAFIDNESDVVQYLSSDEQLTKLGIADAAGIVNYYHLTKKDDSSVTQTSSLHEIAGTSSVTAGQLEKYYTNAGKTYPRFYSSSDAPTLADFCKIYVEEAEKENIKAEVAFCQAMKETGWLSYGGQVQIEQYNFGGLGAVDGGAAGASFSSVREGVRAQIQHLKAYANNEDLNETCVDPRFDLVARGTASYVEWLGQKENPNGKGWATGQNYGYAIVDMMNELLDVQ